MVGPGDPSADRRRLGAGFVGLVAVSGALMGIQGGAGVETVAGLGLVGGLTGGALLVALGWRPLGG